ncbi:unnamed protein product, partial [Oppiella nova]
MITSGDEDITEGYAVPYNHMMKEFIERGIDFDKRHDNEMISKALEERHEVTSQRSLGICVRPKRWGRYSRVLVVDQVMGNRVVVGETQFIPGDDVITEVNGNAVDSVERLSQSITGTTTETVDLTVRRFNDDTGDYDTITLIVKPEPITSDPVHPKELPEFFDSSKYADEELMVEPHVHESETEDPNNNDGVPDEEMTAFFRYMDNMYFRGRLYERGVRIKVSTRLKKNWTRIVKTTNSYEIRMTDILVDNDHKHDMPDYVLDAMIKVNGMIARAEGMTTGADDLGDEELEKLILKTEKMSLAAETLEEMDPKPCINELFRRYDKRFFDGLLHGNDVDVGWSYQMKRSAGITYADRGDRPIIIRLCRRLLFRSPRRDLVETLLHEMIHAWMLIHGVEEDNGGHGRVFHKKMDELNRETGLNIAVGHNLPDIDPNDDMNRFEKTR